VSRGGAGGVGPRVRTHPASARGSYGFGANPVRKNYPTPMPYGFVLMHSLVGPTQPKKIPAPPLLESSMTVALCYTYIPSYFADLDKIP
jgi:hypothetical protein